MLHYNLKRPANPKVVPFLELIIWTTEGRGEHEKYPLESIERMSEAAAEKFPLGMRHYSREIVCSSLADLMLSESV